VGAYECLKLQSIHIYAAGFPISLSGDTVLLGVVQGIENYEREKALYDGIVMEYLELEDIVRNQSNPGGPYSSTLHRALPTFLAYMEWWWKCVLRGPVLRQVQNCWIYFKSFFGAYIQSVSAQS